MKKNLEKIYNRKNMKEKLEKIYNGIFKILDENGKISVTKQYEKIKEIKEIKKVKNIQTRKIIKIEDEEFEINLINFNDIENEFTEKKYPFLNYIIETVAKCPNKYKNNLDKIPEKANENFKELLKNLFIDFLDTEIINDLSETNNKNSKRLLEKLNDISLLKYEGKNISGRIVFCNKQIHKDIINFKLKFQEKISLKSSRQIRKILEMSDIKFFLIGDYDYIYGMGSFKNLENIKEQKIFAIDFKESRHYLMYEIYTEKFIQNYNSKTLSQHIEFKTKKTLIANIKNNLPKSYETRYSQSALEETLNDILTTLKVEKKDIKLKIDQIKKILNIAKEQKKGTMLVFLPSEIAKSEIKKLNQSAIVLDSPVKILESIYKITSIDGAVLLDYNCNCFGIGVILDGLSDKDLGDPSRGARYNSALKYINKENLKKKCLIIVISEDGMIDILPKRNDISSKSNKYLLERNKQINTSNWKKVIETSSKLIKLNPINEINYISRGDAHANLGNYKDAISDYNQAILLDPNYMNAYNNRAEIQLFLEKYNLALIDLVKYLKIDEKHKFMIDISQKNYDNFKTFLENIKTKNDLEKEILQRLITKDEFTIK